MKIVSKAIRDAARDEPCTVQIVGVCNGRTDTTVLAHLPDESGGMGRKSDDLSACFACSACHDAIDYRVRSRLDRDEREFYARRAQTRTLRRLLEKGVVTIRDVRLNR